jgi:hypothetical protein
MINTATDTHHIAILSYIFMLRADQQCIGIGYIYLSNIDIAINIGLASKKHCNVYRVGELATLLIALQYIAIAA